MSGVELRDSVIETNAWLCCRCDSYYASEDDARGCCPEEIWECLYCFDEFDNRDDAQECWESHK